MAKAKAKATEFQHMAIFAELVTAAVFKEIVTTAIESAKAGDAAAREWISMYCMGRPSDVPCRLSGIDLAERMQAGTDEAIGSLYPSKKGRK